VQTVSNTATVTINPQ